MLRKIRKLSQGFTIIEVLIVLAIAGLIMVVVFLAVPALQRNQRNQAQRTEANNLLAAYQEISNNKGGAILAVSDSSTAGSNAADVLAAAGTQNITAVSITAYVAGSITSISSGVPTATQISPSKAIIRLGSKCTAADSGVALAGQPRQVAVYSYAEKGDGSAGLYCANS